MNQAISMPCMANICESSICRITPLPDYILSVSFDDGKRVLYDVKEDMGLPGYALLQEVEAGSA